LVLGIFAALSEFERELISERTRAGLASARARGRKRKAPFKMTVAKVRLAMAAMGKPKTKVADPCRELGVTRQTLYRDVSSTGNLREDGRKTIINIASISGITAGYSPHVYTAAKFSVVGLTKSVALELAEQGIADGNTGRLSRIHIRPLAEGPGDGN
jgi:NAD(P)-dependent dehydrogenase (short-subunit alcohol dehydrogenase family)